MAAGSGHRSLTFDSFIPYNRVMSFELLFLGTGTSAGIPMIGCECAVCCSQDPRDRRGRASVLVSYPELRVTAEGPEPASDGLIQRRVLIDTAPELRLQMTRHRINRVDAVLYTHAHADHIFGLDDLRRFNVVMNAPVKIYAEELVLSRFREMFRYIFEPHLNENQSFVPELLAQRIEPGQAIDLFGARWTPLRLLHGRLPIVGFRLDQGGCSLAYCTDVSSIPPDSREHLRGLDVLVIDGLRYRPHPTHLSIEQALEVIAELGPRRAFLTHIAHDIAHADLDPRLPAGVQLAFDGLSVEV